MGRYSTYNESTFRRHFATFFDWLDFNNELEKELHPNPTDEMIAAVDCSFITKSGKHTFG